MNFEKAKVVQDMSIHGYSFVCCTIIGYIPVLLTVEVVVGFPYVHFLLLNQWLFCQAVVTK